LKDPHLQEVGFLQEIEHPSEGKIQQIGLTNQFSGGMRQDFLPAPQLGENTIELMQQFGFSMTEIEAAISQQAVKKNVQKGDEK
jgi:crotonobetainyl-CoA:carnitine CoA-transferase CaiB-like acyl-CoA transferase